MLESVEFDVPGAKWLSEFYIVCVASDNYKVVFPGTKFSTAISEKTGSNSRGEWQADSAIRRQDIVNIPSDYATGRRYVKGLSKIIIKRAG